MKHRITAALAGFLALFGMSSCLEVEQIISLKKDGSGTISEEVVMGAQMLAMFEGGLGGLGGEANQNPLGDLYDEAKYKERAASFGEGVSFSKLEKVERDGGKGAKVTYAFEDINKVKFSPGSAMDDINPNKEDEEEKAEAPLTFTYADGELTINFPDVAGAGGDEAAAPAADNPVAEAMAAQMVQMFKDMKIAAKLKAEGGIAETDATYAEGDTITLMELIFAEIVKNPDGIKALQVMEDGNRAQMQKALEGVKGVKFETKEKVRVKLK